MTNFEFYELKRIARFINEQAGYARKCIKNAPEDSKEQAYWQGVADTADNINRKLTDFLVEVATDKLLEELKHNG